MAAFRDLAVRLHPETRQANTEQQQQHSDSPPGKRRKLSGNTSSSQPRQNDDNHLPSARYLFYRPTAAAPASDRTLLVVNVPFYWSVSQLSELFSCFGVVEGAIINSGRETHTHKANTAPETDTQAETDRGTSMFSLDAGQQHQSLCVLSAPSSSRRLYYRSALVTYSSASSVQLAMTIDLNDTRQPYIPCVQPVGLSRWMHEYECEHPDVNVLQQSVTAFMQEFDSAAAEKRATLSRQPLIDEEGFQLVRSTRRPSDRHSSRTLPRGVSPSLPVKHQHANFYRFQQREEKAAALIELKKRFESDKQKIAELRAKRKFRPI